MCFVWRSFIFPCLGYNGVKSWQPFCCKSVLVYWFSFCFVFSPPKHKDHSRFYSWSMEAFQVNVLVRLHHTAYIHIRKYLQRSNDLKTSYAVKKKNACRWSNDLSRYWEHSSKGKGKFPFFQGDIHESY